MYLDTFEVTCTLFNYGHRCFVYVQSSIATNIRGPLTKTEFDLVLVLLVLRGCVESFANKTAQVL